jgi:hypothetical protein
MYLGLPLHFKKLTKNMVLSMIQKIASRLLGWKRNLLSYPGRELLVKTVLTAIPTNFLMIHKPHKWAIREVDRFRRSFLWRGEDPDKVRGEHCLVKWRSCIRPKRLGGLDIKDLEKHNRALRLHWLWYNWDATDRPWKKLLKVRDKTDRALFFASTMISVGDGVNTPFWEARWPNGISPQQLAPKLYMQARFKLRSVHEELQNQNWIKNLKHVDSEELLGEFILLYQALSEIQLNWEKDTIHWIWNRNGVYSAAFTYDAQFIGAYPQFNAPTISQAESEPKCHFFTWLAALRKAHTSDNLSKKN